MNYENNLKQLDIQIAFNGALIFAISINIYITKLYKDNLISKTNVNKNKIYSLALLSSNIFLIVTIYFLVLSYENYQSEKDEPSFNFYMASVLSYIAQSIRVSSIIKYPDSISGSEDVL